MKFEVPQFIDIEDKIFGPLTWRQFLYLGGGVGMGVVLFFMNKIIFLIIGLPLAILAGALAFYTVNNRPFSFFLESIFNYIKNSKLYLWKQKDEYIHKNLFTPKIPNHDGITSEIKRTPSTKTVSSMARRLELEALQKKE